MNISPHLYLCLAYREDVERLEADSALSVCDHAAGSASSDAEQAPEYASEQFFRVLL